MAAFSSDDEDAQDTALRLLSSTPVTLFWRREVLDATVGWLAERNYQIVSLDASRWSTESDLHREVASALSFPDYYGRNLDALNDCMRDVVAQEYGWSADSTGLVLTFIGYDRFARASAGPAQAVLDIAALHSRYASLLGKRLLCLVQSDDPQIRFEAVGATPVLWNDSEWLDSRRR